MKSPGVSCSALEREGDLPSAWVLRSLKNRTVEAMVPSAPLLAPGENRTQDMLPAWGRLAAAGREAMTFSLKEVQVMKGGRAGCYRLHLVLKLSCSSTSSCFLPRCLKLILTYLGMTLLKQFHPSLPPHCCSSQS